MAQPLLSRLKAAGAKIDVLAPEWVAPVLRRMREVDEVIAMPYRHGALQLGERWRLSRSLARRGYDRAIVLPNSWKSALIPFLAGIPQRAGYVGELRYGLLNSTLAELEVADAAALCAARRGAGGRAAATAPCSVHARKSPRRKSASASPALTRCFVPAPSTARPSAGLTSRSSPSACPCRRSILGSASDREAAAGIRGKDLVGRTTLDEAIRLIAGAAVVVSNDSGLMHVAAALGRPQVALFGSSSPEHTPPASANARVLWLRLECSPCFARECPLGHFRCMKEISVDQVLKVL